MEILTQNTDFSNLLRNIGPDSTAVFDESDSNPTELASRENLVAASKLDDEDEDEEEGEDEGEDEDVEEDFDDEDEDDEDDDEEEDDDDDKEEEDDEEDEDELQVSERR